jgi:tetratricopeptide (TPR) repeat protein
MPTARSAGWIRRAQALVLRARAAPADPARATAAFEAAGTALELAPEDPAAIQVRLLACLPLKDFASGQRAWERLDPAGAAPADLAAVNLARVALDVAQGAPAQARRAMDEAQRVDPTSPDVYLWSAWLAVQGQNAPGALAALRKAVAKVSSPVPAVTRTLPLPADVGAITNGLVTLAAGDATHEQDLLLGMAVLDWLGQEPDRALARVTPVVSHSEDADLWGLYARLLAARHDDAAAIEAAGRAAALDPRQPAWTALGAQARAAGKER